MVNQPWATAQAALCNNAYCVCNATARPGSLVQNPLRGIAVEISVAESCRQRLGTTRARVLAWRCQSADGESMELLKLVPPEFGVAEPGVYVIDDDGAGIYAGPFDDETGALAWIEQRQRRLSRGVPDRAGAF